MNEKVGVGAKNGFCKVHPLLVSSSWAIPVLELLFHHNSSWQFLPESLLGYFKPKAQNFFYSHTLSLLASYTGRHPHTHTKAITLPRTSPFAPLQLRPLLPPRADPKDSQWIFLKSVIWGSTPSSTRSSECSLWYHSPASNTILLELSAT